MIEFALDRTRRHWRQTGFAWGTSDCLISVALYARDLLVANGGDGDPSAPWFATYSSEAEAVLIRDEAGGTVRLLDRGLIPHGFKRVQIPVRGDILAVDVGTAVLGGICLGKMTMLRTDRGTMEFRTARLKIDGAWRL